jgi:hypothetical protein
MQLVFSVPNPPALAGYDGSALDGISTYGTIGATSAAFFYSGGVALDSGYLRQLQSRVTLACSLSVWPGWRCDRKYIIIDAIDYGIGDITLPFLPRTRNVNWEAPFPLKRDDHACAKNGSGSSCAHAQAQNSVTNRIARIAKLERGKLPGTASRTRRGEGWRRARGNAPGARALPRGLECVRRAPTTARNALRPSSRTNPRVCEGNN